MKVITGLIKSLFDPSIDWGMQNSVYMSSYVRWSIESKGPHYRLYRPIYLCHFPCFRHSNPYIFPSFPSLLPSFRSSQPLLPQPIDQGAWFSVCRWVLRLAWLFSIYITHILVSKSTPLAVIGPYGQLASILFYRSKEGNRSECCGQLWVRHMFCGRDLWWT